MAVQYEIQVRENYLYFLGNGIEEGLAGILDNLRMIVHACGERNLSHVLIDDRLVIYTASISSLYEFAKQFEQIDFSKSIQKAAVVSVNKYRSDNKFFENSMRNRNINLRVFYDIDKAEKWLEE